MSYDLARWEDVKNSFTKKRENCITGEPSTMTIVSKLDIVDGTVVTLQAGC
jgi:hypothetical protein